MSGWGRVGCAWRTGWALCVGLAVSQWGLEAVGQAQVWAAVPAETATPTPTPASRGAAPVAPTSAPSIAPSNASPNAPASSPMAGLPVLPASEVQALREGAARLGVEEQLVIQGVTGLEALYLRQYAGARELFKRLEVDHPSSAIGPFGAVMLAQAMMSENLDYSQDQAYQRAAKVVRERTEAAIRRGDAKAWNHFLRGCLAGVNGIYLYRMDKRVQALDEGWSAISDLQEARRLDPSFNDPLLGLGIYDYWRSYLTRRYKSLGMFPDKRAQGIREMELARDRGIITPVLARVAIAFTYAESGQARKALPHAEGLLRDYPRNTILLQLQGQLLTRTRRIVEAQRAFDRVLEIDPKAAQVHYYLGNLYYLSKKDYARANREYQTFLNAGLENFYRPSAYLRLGDTHYLMGDLTSATRAWKSVTGTGGAAKSARARLEGKYPKDRRVKPSAAPIGAVAQPMAVRPGAPLKAP